MPFLPKFTLALFFQIQVLRLESEVLCLNKLGLFFIFYSYTHLLFNSYTPATGRNWLCFLNLLLTAGIAKSVEENLPILSC